MGMRTTFMVQTFEIHRKRLRPGNRDVAPTESGALKQAEAIARPMPGTAARRIVADDGTGGLESTANLGRFSEVLKDICEKVKKRSRRNAA
ncbi:hypothetical protein [Methylobacterium tarhaniae]|uniref:hypothetical protein n=1 Tax=Methylobacterium tarhaniae TaxID=1187852 RepID=UPI003D0650A4